MKKRLFLYWTLLILVVLTVSGCICIWPFCYGDGGRSDDHWDGGGHRDGHGEHGRHGGHRD